MSARSIIRFSSLFIAFAFGLGFFGGTAAADTYNVNASVPYEAPSQAAVIDHPDDGAAFDDVQQTVTGTCQAQNPAAVVSIWREGVSLGSVGCVSGRFSIAVVLTIGQNNLVARTANVSGLYGPDSLTKTFNVNYPKSAEPLPSGVNQPTTVESRAKAINQGGIAGLSLTTETPYEILPSSKKVTLRIIVNGGQQPYVLQLKWGDGSTESHSLDQAGTYDFTHTYLQHKTYSVYAYVRDVLGAYTEHVYAVISGQKSTTSAGTTKTMTPNTQNGGQWRPAGVIWYYWILIILALIILLLSYLVGYRRGRERLELEVERRLVASKKKQKRAKK